MDDKNLDPALAVPEKFLEEDELKQLQNSDDVDKLRELLKEGEIVARLVLCTVDGSDAVLAATNKRIIFCDKQFIGAEVMTFKYKEVAVVIYNPELVTHKLTLAHSEGSLSVEGVDLEHGQRFIEFIQDRIGQDYKVKGKNGRAMEHIGEMIQLTELPSQN